MVKSEIWTDGPMLLGNNLSSTLDDSPLTRQLPRQSVDAHEILDGVLKECRPRIKAKSLHVSVRLLSRQYHINDDGERLRQTYLNLLNNAIANSRPGSNITLRAYCPTDCALRLEIEERSAWRMKLAVTTNVALREKAVPVRGHR